MPFSDEHRPEPPQHKRRLPKQIAEAILALKGRELNFAEMMEDTASASEDPDNARYDPASDEYWQHVPLDDRQLIAGQMRDLVGGIQAIAQSGELTNEHKAAIAKGAELIAHAVKDWAMRSKSMVRFVRNPMITPAQAQEPEFDLGINYTSPADDVADNLERAIANLNERIRGGSAGVVLILASHARALANAQKEMEELVASRRSEGPQRATESDE